MDHKRSRTPIFVAVLLTLPLLYVLSYLLLIQKSAVVIWSIGVLPEYRLGGKAADLFFKPVHIIDRNVRKEYWTDDE